jgi:hypothetical protein
MKIMAKSTIYNLTSPPTPSTVPTFLRFRKLLKHF